MGGEQVTIPRGRPFGAFGQDRLPAPARVKWGVMSEVVVLIGAEEGRDPSRLMSALDAFAKWAAESGLFGNASEAPDIMMKSEFADGEMRRKLVFQNRDQAASFLNFWRIERHRTRTEEAFAASA